MVLIAFLTALGGGLIRDLSIGAIPPVGLSSPTYLVTVFVGSLVAVYGQGLLSRLSRSVLFFDSIGLGLFAVSGANKAYLYTQNIEVAILLGRITGVGGGLIRDVILNRIPVILQKEVYALAALLGACVQILGEKLGLAGVGWAWCSVALCVSVRLLALKYGWQVTWPFNPKPPDHNS